MTGRRARALVLITASALVAGVVAIWYVAPLLAPAPPAVLPVVAGPATYSAVGESVAFTFRSSTTGWAAASIARDRIFIYATTDGAKTWRQVGRISSPPSTAVAQLRFFDAAHGLIVLGGMMLAAYRTTDAGRAWSTITLPDAAIASLDFSDAMHGWASAAGGALYETTDGGATWQALPRTPLVGAWPVFATAFDGWLGGPPGGNAVYRTRDGGESWQVVQLPARTACSGTPYACAPAGDREASAPVGSADVITVLGKDGVMVWDQSVNAGFVSLDSGATWRQVTLPAGLFDYSEIRFEDAAHWWLIDSNALYKTHDAGQTWSVASDHIIYDRLQPNIVDPLHAWCALQVTSDTRLGARPDTVWELNLTSDGGLHWTQGTVPVPA